MQPHAYHLIGQMSCSLWMCRWDLCFRQCGTCVAATKHADGLQTCYALQSASLWTVHFLCVCHSHLPSDSRCIGFATHVLNCCQLMQVVKKCKVQLQNRLVPDGPVQVWLRRIEGLQPDIDSVLQVGPMSTTSSLCVAPHPLAGP